MRPLLSQRSSSLIPARHGVAGPQHGWAGVARASEIAIRLAKTGKVLYFCDGDVVFFSFRPSVLGFSLLHPSTKTISGLWGVAGVGDMAPDDTRHIVINIEELLGAFYMQRKVFWNRSPSKSISENKIGAFFFRFFVFISTFTIW